MEGRERGGPGPWLDRVWFYHVDSMSGSLAPVLYNEGRPSPEILSGHRVHLIDEEPSPRCEACEPWGRVVSGACPSARTMWEWHGSPRDRARGGPAGGGGGWPWLLRGGRAGARSQRG